MATTNYSTLTGIPVVQPVISEWQSFTPTWNNVTMSGATGFWKREGDSMRIRVDGNPSGAGSAALVTVSMPTGYTIDTSKLVAVVGNLNAIVGQGIFYDDSVTYERPLFVCASSSSALDFRTSGTERSILGNELASGDQLSWEALVPITEWAGQAYVGYGSGQATATVPGLVSPRKGQANLSVSGTQSWVTGRAVGIYYQDQSGNHRLKFNITGTCSNVSKTGITLTISGIVAKNVSDNYQPVACTAFTASASVVSVAYANPNNGVIAIEHSASSSATNRYGVSGDIELESKPSWA